VLDVAAGSGRHSRWLSAQGFAVTAIDRDGAAMRALQGQAETIVADIEADPWPLAGRTFDAVLVTNYLWRPLLTTLVAAVGERGVLIVETFAAGQETVGRPARPDYLLEPGELLGVARGLRIVAFEDGFLDDPQRFVQRVAAVRVPAASASPRHPLQGPDHPAPDR